MPVHALHIGVDLMGGDRSPTLLFQALKQSLESFPDVHFTVFVTQSIEDEIRSSFAVQNERLHFYMVSDVIEMQDEPLTAIRRKKKSSLVLGLELLQKKVLDGFVSLCNTGALIAGVSLFCSLLPGIKRPALLANLPTKTGHVVVIDVGGNVSCKADHLVQFAQLGVAYQRLGHGIERPRVALLNIGVESKKGTSEIRQAYQLLQMQAQNGAMQFLGNIEGKEVFQGVADVLVTDGFTGNVLLKTSEGVSFFILQQLRNMLEGVLPEQRELIEKSFYHQFDDEEYNGAIICGIDRVVVKCHGRSSPRGLCQGIKKAIQLVRQGFIFQIEA